MERTLAIIKPDAVGSRLAGRILQRIEDSGFQIRAMRMLHLSVREAEGFYAVHRERPFFASLTKFMSSGPVIVLALEAEDAIRRWRSLMGATDPAKAEAGTLRKEFGRSIENNATHGSDAADTAAFELGYFFPGPKLTPVFQFAQRNVDDTEAGDERRWSLGVNYWWAAHNANIKAAYGRIDPSGQPEQHQFTVQLQLFYY